MKNVALISIILVYHTITCNVFANNYILLSSFDKLCKERHDKGFVANYVVDEITIREQLVLSWPGDLNTSSFYNPSRNPKFALCPGLVIHPSGRFVKRSFPEGLALFWLLRANIHFTCPKNTHLSESFYLQLEQWIESLEWNKKHWRQDALKDQDGDTIDSTNIGEEPDEILLINCSSSYVGQSNHWSLSGYLRRIRITWKLRNETEVTDLTTITNTSLSSTSSTSSVIFLNTSISDSSLSSSSSYLNNLNNQHFLSRSGIKFLVRISSHMIFVGNFSMERQKALCEFFSGFWCLQSLSTFNTTTSNHHHQDKPSSLLSSSTSMSSSSLTPLTNQHNILSSKHPICVQATMLCDSLPDCDLRVPMNQVNLSQDEANCNMIPSNYSPKTSSKLYKDDHWISKLPWIVLAPVPAILICALIRICSQKRQLDLIEDNNNHYNFNIHNLNECSTMISNSTTIIDHCDKCIQIQYKKKLPTHYFIMKQKLRHYHGSIPGILNRINKLSSVTEVDDEIDPSIEQQGNILNMKPLNNNNNNNNTIKTKLTKDSNHCCNSLKHCYSLPEFTIKHDNDDGDDDNGFNSDVMFYSVNNGIISNRNFQAISTCSSCEASTDDDDDRLNVNHNLMTHYQSIEAFNKSKSCDSLHETSTENVRMNGLSISPCSSTTSSIDFNNDGNKRNPMILSDSSSDNSQFILNFPKTMMSNQNSNNYLLSNLNLNIGAQYNNVITNNYNTDSNQYRDPSRNLSLSASTTPSSTLYYHHHHRHHHQKCNYSPLAYSSNDIVACYSSSLVNFSPNSFESPRKLSTVSKCIKHINQLISSSLTLINYSKNNHVHNSKTKLLMMESKYIP
uniref:Guanylate cyclase n=1 Tax=Schistosoma mansoni TaxID=6183 RepID=A0A3Q0KKS4_SCHMA